jgi:hypothetical protein
MIKIVLGVDDTLWFTIGARSPTPPSIDKPSAFERHKPSYRSVTTLDARRLPTFNCDRLRLDEAHGVRS